jgi:hypothetical protein
MCVNCHVINVFIICSTCNVHYNVCHSKSKVHKSGFLWGSIATNDGPILLTIEGKWFGVIMRMRKFEFLNLAHPKQVQLFISICVCGKFQLSPTSVFVTFQEDTQKFILEIDKNLSVEGLVAPLATKSSDNV